MILDSDIVVDILRKRPEAVSWAFGATSMATIPGIAALEVLYGANSAVELQRTQKVIAKFQITWPTSEDAIFASSLSALSLSNGLGILDALIAACAICNDVPLATFNVKHFSAVPGLKVIQPYVRL